MFGEPQLPSRLHAVSFHEGMWTSQCPKLVAGSCCWSRKLRQGLLELKEMQDGNSIPDVNQAKMLRGPCSGSSPKQWGEKKPKTFCLCALHMKCQRRFATSAGFQICFSFLVFQSSDVPWADPAAGRQFWPGRWMWVQLELGWAALPSLSPQDTSWGSSGARVTGPGHPSGGPRWSMVPRAVGKRLSTGSFSAEEAKTPSMVRAAGSIQEK